MFMMSSNNIGSFSDHSGFTKVIFSPIELTPPMSRTLRSIGTGDLINISNLIMEPVKPIGLLIDSTISSICN